jgi:hypothetical protein
MSKKNSNYAIGNRNRDLPTCSAISPPTAAPRASLKLGLIVFPETLLITTHAAKIPEERRLNVVADFLGRMLLACCRIRKLVGTLTGAATVFCPVSL